MGPRLLIIETSGRIAEVALAEGENVRGARRLDEARRHARDLAPAVKELLAAAGCKPREVQAVIVSRGPGSYTGLRVGIMSAKAFAYAAGCAILAVDTFAAIARRAPPEVQRLDVLGDAQQDNVYVQHFDRPGPGGPLIGVSSLVICPFSQWLTQCQPGTAATGPGIRGKEGRLREDSVVVDGARWDPRAESLLELGLDRYLRGDRDDLWAVEPLYLRPSAAEQQWRDRPKP
jgi:tRNA threonylcarbamoyladenosine biosynthesis protein TsaB